MRPEHRAGEGAVGHGRRRTTQLTQSPKPQLAHACEVGIGQPWPQHHVAKKRECIRHHARQAREGQRCRVRPDVDLEVGAEPRECLGYAYRVAGTGALVHQVRRQARQARQAWWVGGRAVADDECDRGHGHT